eukprot:scaffold77465_cov43-Attheya_sp.AAC.4
MFPSGGFASARTGFHLLVLLVVPRQLVRVVWHEWISKWDATRRRGARPRSGFRFRSLRLRRSPRY